MNYLKNVACVKSDTKIIILLFFYQGSVQFPDTLHLHVLLSYAFDSNPVMGSVKVVGPRMQL